MDELDKKILKLLQENARIAYSEIGRTLNLSVPAVSKRVGQLEKKNIIQCYTAILNPEKFEKRVTCYCFIILKNKTPETDRRFFDFTQSQPDILECHCITGEYEFLLKIASETTKHLEMLLVKLRQDYPVVRTNTCIVLSSSKEHPSISPA